jgi:hypothetical protein
MRLIHSIAGLSAISPSKSSESNRMIRKV